MRSDAHTHPAEAPPVARRARADTLADQVLSAAAGATFDFRSIASPGDPDAHLFEEWVDRYRRAWALARVLEPDTVLGIGTGYGYTAAALLSARPGATYVGIDPADPAGDEAGRWAAGILDGFDATLATAAPPSGTFDLVHVGGAGDGDRLFADLELALAHGRYVLVERYDDRTRFLAANEFLFQHRDELRSSSTLLGPTAELLVEVGDEVVGQPGSTTTSGELRHLYDARYFLQDCAGHDAYKRSHGARIRDPRLAAVASIGGLVNPQRVLDLGCGRGELTFHFARHGARVTGVDYSPEAVQLAEACFAGAPDLRARVDLLVGDVCTVPLDGPFDLAVASDLVEHLTPGELDLLYGRVAGGLSDDGVLVVHTFPNRWYYEREYPRRRAQAAALGAYLPPEPRSRYERLMHINEQSPDDLRHQLGKHFASVVVWYGEPADLGRTLEPSASGDLDVAPGLYALASQTAVDAATLRAAMAMTPLMASDVAGVNLRVTSCPDRAGSGHAFEATVRIDNGGSRALRSNGPNPFHLSYRWLDRDGRVVVADGRRTLVFPWLPAGASEEYDVAVDPPDEPGDYVLRLTAVQELVAWFDHLAEDVEVTVGPSTWRGSP